MKFYIKLFILFFFFQNFLIAQSISKDSIFVSAAWKKGEKKSYKTTETKLNKTDSIIVKNELKHVFISFEVLDHLEDGYLLKYQKDSLQIPGMALTGMNKQIAALLSKTAYEFKTDPYGEYKEVTNWEEVKTNSLQLLNDWIASIEDEEDRALYSKIQKGMEGNLMSKEMIEHTMLKDIGAIFFNYGYVYPINDTLRYEELLPAPIGQGTVKANSSFVAHHDQAANTVTFKTSTIVDEETGKEYIISILKTFMNEIEPEEKTTEMEDIFRNARMEILIESEVTYDLHSGWMIESNSLRKVVFNDTKSTNIGIEEAHIKAL